MRPISSLVAAAFLAAAASFAQSVRQPDAPDACSLLSGIPVTDGVRRVKTGLVTGCSSAGLHGARVAVLVRRTPAGGWWVAEQVARMNRGVALGTYRKAPGIGNSAFLYALRSGAVLCVFTPGYYLQFSLLHGTGEEPRTAEALESLALNAVARLANTRPTNGQGFSPQRAH